MNRDDAAQYLSEPWPDLATALGVMATDDAAGWKGAIDAALRAMGVARADLAGATVDTADEADFEALLRYHGALRLYAAAMSKVDVSVGDVGVSKRYSQLDRVEKLVARYEGELPEAYRGDRGMVAYAYPAQREIDPYAVEDVTA